MKNKKKLLFWGIVLIVMFSLWLIHTKPTKKGLDLVGGSRLVLEAQTTETIAKITPDMMDSLLYAIEQRVNALGVSETIVQKEGEKRLIVEIPDVSDPKKAKEFLGETAELEFKKNNVDLTKLTEEQKNGVVGIPQEWVSTGISGKDIRKAMLATSQTGQWVVSLEFNDTGAKKFADVTRKMVGQPLAIFFNGELKSAPVIQEAITGGQAQISGGDSGFEYDEAKKMVDLLNAGALPIPAKIIEENTVGPTLGAESIQKSKFAGALGLGLVMIFMLLVYGLPGMIANVALMIYGIIVFAIFKTIPVTLTLAGIAGFILSIGMAVDANILIFERTKEELKSGRSMFQAINSGFDRAFTSIFDSNMTTIITCIILYMLGTSIVKGFALTLAIGVIISMFTAITVTKNFMHLLFDMEAFKNPKLFGVKESDIQKGFEAQNTKREKAKFGVLD